MAKYDVAMKRYVSDKERFADLMNGSLFHGEQVVKPENLIQTKGEAEMFLTDKNGKRKNVTRYRDVIMKTDFAVFAEENQMNVHYGMAVRNMLYDALSYAEQIEQIRKEHERNGDKLSGGEFLSGMTKEDEINPVITVVLYLGEEEWDASLDLYGMMKIGREGLITEDIKDILPNYKINLVNAGNVNNLNEYKSSLQLVFGMLKYKTDKEGLKQYLEEHKNELENTDEDTYNVLGVLLNAEEKFDKYKNREGRERKMFKAFEEMLEDSKNEGRDEMKQELLRAAKELKEVLPDEVIAEKMNLSLEIVKEL